ncbi:MAG: hypothetical protein JETT_3856 [Candidatus Jettenia ecosi]|uniref:Uncharacterized protein n=1 Tax=Candidatus Jettenia ecosi TaxID=2494326 RepID=A0A533Q6Y2_9BACT|nr:MAG: hypothetical protein JETT_3856 [Candidatus Jettenia ecosi]
MKVLIEHPEASIKDFVVEIIKEIEVFKCSEDSYSYVFSVLQSA